MQKWQLLITPQLSGQQNMNYDLQLFNDFEAGKISSTLRIYSWKPRCISFGYAQKMERWIKKEEARGGPWGRGRGWDIVKRPTGGGIVFHNEEEVTYSLVTAIDNPILPKGLVPAYKKLSEAVVVALGKVGIVAEIQSSNIKYQNPALRDPESIIIWNRDKSQIQKPNLQASDSQLLASSSHLCFSFPSEYEVVVDGRKIVGSAQKRGKRALLQQGSIFVSPTPHEAFSVLKSKQNKLNAISVAEILGKKVSFDELSTALIEGFKEVLHLESLSLGGNMKMASKALRLKGENERSAFLQAITRR